MKMTYPTRSEKYFVDLFHSATLQGAVERAASRERGEGADECSTVPVDVFGLARERGMEIIEDLVGESCGEGLLIPFRGGYRVRLRKASTSSRKRFSVAHELGHTFFYKDNGDGPRHQIGILNTSERNAEERICNWFASALLIPASELRQKLGGLPSDAPSAVLSEFEKTARYFGVSLPALLYRLRSIQLVDAPGYIFLCMSERANAITRKDVALRVELSVPVGSWRDLYIWRNRSAQGLGLKNASMLYKEWEGAYRAAPTKGSFSINPSSGALDQRCKAIEVEEHIHLSRVAQGKWKNERTRVLCANRLYAWSDASDGMAYVLSAIALAR
jgi:hypothetical protein